MSLPRRRRTPQGPFEARIDDLTQEGAGVAHVAGKAVFIPDALPGEKVSYLSLRRKRSYDEGRLVEVLEASPLRTRPRCEHFGLCGGCSLQHLEPTAQVEFKQRQLLEALSRIGGVKPDEVLPPVMGPFWGYRRRARLAARHVEKKGGVLVGFREREKPMVAVLKSCHVLDGRFGQRLVALGTLINSLSICDRVPQIEVAAADNAPAMVLRVLSEPTPDDCAKLERFSREESIWIFLQPGSADTIRPLLPDTPELVYRLPGHGIEIAFAPTDFIQVNGAVNAAMVDQALDLLDLRPTDTVLELFSGLGNFSLPMARRAVRVVAVEGERGLVARAHANAQRNRVANVEHHVADLAAVSSDASWARRYDKVLIDPPRVGAQEVIPVVLATGASRVLYVSCHPGTLARDAALLAQGGYRLRAAGVMDMFPHTSHVESMALFVRRDGG